MSCSSSTPVALKHSVVLPPNALSSPVHYQIKLTATAGDGSTSTNQTHAVEVEAFDLVTSTLSFSNPTTTNSVSCATLTVCSLVGPGGYTGIQTGALIKWSRSNGADLLRTVSCTPSGTSVCGVISGTGLGVAKVTGLKKTTEVIEWRTGEQLTSISCVGEAATGPNASTTECIVAANEGTVYQVQVGKTTLVTHVVTKLSGAAFAACSTASSCTVVDVNGDGVAFNGSTWSSTPSNLDASGGVTSTSCALDGTCVLADSHGGLYSYVAKPKQLTRVAVRESPTLASTSLRLTSCVVGYCLAVGDDGTITQRVVGVWASTNKGRFAAGDMVRAVSCFGSSSTSPVGAVCVVASKGGPGLKQKFMKGHVVLVK